MKDDICIQHMKFKYLKRIDRSYLPEGEQGFNFNSTLLNLLDCCIGVSSFNHNLLKITFRSNFSSTTLQLKSFKFDCLNQIKYLENVVRNVKHDCLTRGSRSSQYNQRYQEQRRVIF